MTGNGRGATEIKRVRNEALVALRVVYPAGLRAESLMRSLLILFPGLEFEQFKRDLHYLMQKGYVEWVAAGEDSEGRERTLTPWRKRWFRLTASGLELAEHCTNDPALEEP